MVLVPPSPLVELFLVLVTLIILPVYAVDRRLLAKQTTIVLHNDKPSLLALPRMDAVNTILLDLLLLVRSQSVKAKY